MVAHRCPSTHPLPLPKGRGLKSKGFRDGSYSPADIPCRIMAAPSGSSSYLETAILILPPIASGTRKTRYPIR